jgi:hypothetical protein
MKKIFLAITLIGLMSCSNQEDELQELINENPPIEVPPPVEEPIACDCQYTWYIETIYKKGFNGAPDEFLHEWEEQTYEKCDNTTNGEKVIVKDSPLPTNWSLPSTRTYYSVICK